jgi:hypothetical protein
MVSANKHGLTYALPDGRFSCMDGTELPVASSSHD